MRRVSPSSLRASVDDRPRLLGLAVGVGHALLSLVLWSLLDFGDLLSSVGTEPLYVFYLVGGMFALGFVPAVLYSKYGSRAPGALSVFLLVGSAFGTYRIVASRLTPVDPTPFGWYLLLWPAPVVLYAVIGAVERTVTDS
jgi:hypothetical protein